MTLRLMSPCRYFDSVAHISTIHFSSLATYSDGSENLPGHKARHRDGRHDRRRALQARHTGDVSAGVYLL